MSGSAGTVRVSPTGGDWRLLVDPLVPIETGSTHADHPDRVKVIMPVQYTSHVDVFLYLHDRDRVLLALRRNTGYADEMWNLPSGKLDAGEHVLAAVVREAREEVGVDLDVSALELAGVLHHRSPELVGRVGLVFSAPYDPARHGVPFNAEPHKCGGIDWYPSDALPEPTVPYTVACVNLVRRGARLGLPGWGLESVDTLHLGMGGSTSP